ncbi:MAG: HAD-IIA family hydrolase [Micrococcales bacterium]
MTTRPDFLYDAYLFDLDGTIYLGEELLPGAQELLEHLRENGVQRVFLSNNPTKDPKMYIEKLARLGIEAEEHEILNTIISTVDWLTKNRPGAKVFPISDAPLINALKAAGIEITEDPAEIDIVIASYDHGFNYSKLQIAFDAIWKHKRAELITTNPDRFCPFPNGEGEPDAAGVVAAIEATTGATCQYNMGKPDQIMIDIALGRINTAKDRAIMIGDRPTTDIQMAINAGIHSALVLTGESQNLGMAAYQLSVKPTYILDRIDLLIPEKNISQVAVAN